MQVSPEQVSVVPSSIVDPIGTLFEYDGDLYRGIRNAHVQRFTSYFESGMADKLVKLGFCATSLANLSVEPFGLVLKHQRIPIVTYPSEWPSALLARAAVFICELQLQLQEIGLSLKDGHPWNVLFDGMQPVFVDWGSIIENDEQCQSAFLSEVENWFLFPLFLKSKGMHKAAATFLKDPSVTPLRTTEGNFWATHSLEPNRRQRLIPGRTFNHLARSIHQKSDNGQKLSAMILAIQSLPISALGSEWATYAGADSTHDMEDQTTWNIKTKNVYKRLTQLNPTTVIDIGCNRGWYSHLAAKHGANVLSLDIDEASLNTLCQTDTHRTQLTASLFDLAAPTEAHGVAGAYPSALKRHSAELVLALAVTHHLFFKRHMPFAAIARDLAALTQCGGTLIVEFVPSNDVHVAKWANSQHESYTLDAFRRELQQHFRSVMTEDAFPEPRVLCVCTK